MRLTAWWSATPGRGVARCCGVHSIGEGQKQADSPGHRRISRVEAGKGRNVVVRNGRVDGCAGAGTYLSIWLEESGVVGTSVWTVRERMEWAMGATSGGGPGNIKWAKSRARGARHAAYSPGYLCTSQQPPQQAGPQLRDHRQHLCALCVPRATACQRPHAVHSTHRKRSTAPQPAEPLVQNSSASPATPLASSRARASQFASRISPIICPRRIAHVARSCATARCCPPDSRPCPSRVQPAPAPAWPHERLAVAEACVRLPEENSSRVAAAATIGPPPWRSIYALARGLAPPAQSCRRRRRGSPPAHNGTRGRRCFWRAPAGMTERHCACFKRAEAR